MPIAIFRGEKSLADIADRMYLRLTPRQRQKVEAEILKANPQLNKLRDVPSGTVIRIRDLPELRPKARRSQENPDLQIADSVAEALTNFGTRYDARVELAKADLQTQISHTKNGRINAVLDKSPELAEAFEATAKGLAARTVSLEKRHDTLAATLKQAQIDLRVLGKNSQG